MQEYDREKKQDKKNIIEYKVYSIWKQTTIKCQTKFILSEVIISIKILDSDKNMKKHLTDNWKDECH